MDEFDEINPFGDEFRPDAPTPAPTPAPSPPTTPTPTTPKLLTPPPAYQEFDDSPPIPLMEETVMLGTSKVKSKGSKYYGYDVEKLKAEAFKLETIKANQEHAEKLLKRTQPLSEQ